MSAVKILGRGEDLLAQVVDLLAPPRQDYSGDLVVFPGKRPAHALRKALADRMNVSFIPPRLHSVNTFIEFVHSITLKIQKPELSRLDAVAILYDVHRKLEQRIGRDSYYSLESFLSVGSKLIGELEEVMMANLSRERIREVMTHVQYQKFHSLSAYYEQFYQEVERRGFVTRAMMYRAVAERVGEIDWSSYRSIILAGFYAFTNVEKVIVMHLLKEENVTLLFQHGVGLQSQLHALGISEESGISPATAPELHFIKAPDLHGQVFALAAQMKEQLKNEPALDRRTAIVLPSSEALFPLIHFGLSLLPEDSYNIALQYPLARTPAYGFLSNLMELVTSAQNGKFSTTVYLRYVLHPYTKNIRYGQRAELTRVFFHAMEEHLVRRYAKAHLSLEEIEADSLLFAEAERRLTGAGESVTREELRAHLASIHDNTIRKFLGVVTVGELAERAEEVLQYIFAESTANRHPYFRPYVERIIEILEDVRTSLLAGQKFDDPLASCAFLQGCLTGDSIPFPGTPMKGLQVLGLLETRNLKFDTLYILDATDDVLPRKPQQDMLLPQGIRALLGLELYRDAERLTEYYFDLAVQSAKTVYLFYSESGDHEKSRFVQQLLWRLQQRDNTASTDEYEQQVTHRARLVNDKPREKTKTPAVVETLRELQWSAQALDTYLACQLRFYYRYVLHLSDREELTEELDAADVGKLVHTVLARYMEPLRDKTLAGTDLSRDRLITAMDDCFGEMFGEQMTGTALLIRRQVEKRLLQFLEQHQTPLVTRQNVRVVGVEQKLEAEYKGHRFTGRVDRIERRGNRVAIIDYKTGGDKKSLAIRREKIDPNDPASWRAAIPSFQLPIYMLLYSRASQEELASIDPSYLLLGNKELDEESELALGDEHSTALDAFNAVEPVMMKTIGMILDPTLPFSATNELEQECPRCPFQTICGTTWVQGWKPG
jgi:hypothetical protein